MSQSLAAARTTAGPAAELVLAGDLERPARLTVPDLLGRPQHRAEVAFECATSGIRRHRFTGPLLHDVLMDAGPVFDPARRKDRLRFLIAVRGPTATRPCCPGRRSTRTSGAPPSCWRSPSTTPRSTGRALSSSCPRTAAAPATSAESRRSMWTAATAPGADDDTLGAQATPASRNPSHTRSRVSGTPPPPTPSTTASSASSTSPAATCPASPAASTCGRPCCAGRDR